MFPRSNQVQEVIFYKCDSTLRKTADKSAGYEHDCLNLLKIAHQQLKRKWNSSYNEENERIT